MADTPDGGGDARGPFKGPQQPGELSREESHEGISRGMQTPAPGEELQAAAQAGPSHLCRKGPWSSGGSQAPLELGMHPHSAGGQSLSLGCVGQSMASSNGEVVLPSAEHWRGHIWSSGPSFLSPEEKKK